MRSSRSSFRWGDSRLPPRAALRGGSLRRISLPLAAWRSDEPGACRAASVGGGDFFDQWAFERRGGQERFMKTRKTIQPLLNAATPWTAWASHLAARHRRWAD